ncbi:MAG: 2-oxo acid dehydrogenase subunit E2 [Actinomycetota bacterium]|nr:2-oxo acid dehydrogenase subunit E2 [Actinomycetota bacterium]
MPEVKMPQLGESVVEGTVTKWLKSEGDTVDEDELLVEISTDKVDSEVPSTASGVLQKILVQEGDTAKVGDAIAVVGEDGQDTGEDGGGSEAAEDEEGESDAPEGQQQERAEDTQDEGEGQEQSAEQEAADAKAEESADKEAADEKTEEDEPEPAEAKGEEGQAEPDGADSSDEAAPQEQPSAETQEADQESPDGAAQPSGDGAGDTSKRRIISPLVRRLADEHSVDLEGVEGTGTGGRIRKQDVLQAAEKQAEEGRKQAEPAPKETGDAEEQDAGAAQPEVGGEREELVPWSNIRRRTAEHMVASHLETARAWNAVEVDWTPAVEVREKAKAAFKEREGFNLTYMPFLARAVCETLLEMPEVNAAFDEANKANLIRRYVNLGVAVALEGGGLIVPVVKGADEKNLVGLARSISEVAQRARTKKVTPDDLTGGTFTITNPGPFGSIVSVPIIPRGQTAILGFEAITKRVVVTEDDAIAVRSIGFLTMSWDHRIIDGAEAARFLARLRERIQVTDFSGDLAQYL